MDRPPPPPHERHWRHPAEISAEHRIVFAAEPPSRRLRNAAALSGTVALAVVGLSAWLIANGSTGPEVASARRQATPSATIIAVPVADGLALATRHGMDDADGADGVADGIGTVTLPDGTVTSAQHYRAVGDLVIVTLDVPSGSAFAVAGMSEGDTLIVHDGHPNGEATPVSITAFDGSSAWAPPVDEGTPVLNGAGHLIGLCSRSGDGVRLVIIDDDVLAVLPSQR